MDARRFGEAGLVGWRARVGKRGAKWVASRTRFEERDLVTLVGAYLFVSRIRRLGQMLRRLQRSA